MKTKKKLLDFVRSSQSHGSNIGSTLLSFLDATLCVGYRVTRVRSDGFLILERTFIVVPTEINGATDNGFVNVIGGNRVHFTNIVEMS